MTKPRRIYECHVCNLCFQHEDVGNYPYGICPNGSDSYCSDVTEEKLKEEQRDGGIPTEE